MEKCKGSSLLWNNKHKVIHLTDASFFIIPSVSICEHYWIFVCIFTKLSLVYSVYDLISQGCIFNQLSVL